MNRTDAAYEIAAIALWKLQTEAGCLVHPDDRTDWLLEDESVRNAFRDDAKTLIEGLSGKRKDAKQG